MVMIDGLWCGFCVLDVFDSILICFMAKCDFSADTVSTEQFESNIEKKLCNLYRLN